MEKQDGQRKALKVRQVGFPATGINEVSASADERQLTECAEVDDAEQFVQGLVRLGVEPVMLIQWPK